MKWHLREMLQRSWYEDCKKVGWSSGGRGRDRTGDPLLAKQVLSQLSYTPTDG